MSQISQLSPSLSPSHNFPCSPANPACGNFRDKSPFLPFLPVPESGFGPDGASVDSGGGLWGWASS